MRRRTHAGMLLPLAALAGLALVGAPAAAGAQACGPGPHWVDTCPSGTDTFGTLLAATLDFAPVGGPTVALNLFGNTTVWRAAGVPHTIAPTEIVSLLASGGGATITAGDGIGNGACDGPLCSLGAIVETDPFHALSFFDVFFEITGAGPFGTLHTWSTHTTFNGEIPCHVEAIIDRVPPLPGTDYLCLNAPIPLYDANDQLRAILLPSNIHHRITPEPASVLLVATGLGCLGAGLARRHRRDV